MNYIDQTKKSF